MYGDGSAIGDTNIFVLLDGRNTRKSKLLVELGESTGAINGIKWSARPHGSLRETHPAVT
jgi:hypothetical protein